ncbi:MAG: chemotaxis protein CheW [Myxococcaceae bacterium]|nr:chemotaxis protein CheW [Myxococcaceae bacterium]
MLTGGPTLKQLLLCRAGLRLCGLPLEHVAETLRPLPVEPVADAPAYVLGLTRLRGRPAPVVDLARLFGSEGAAAPTRFVALRLSGRQLALAVTHVAGVRGVDPTTLEGVPAIAGELEASVTEHLGTADAELLVVLQATKLLPESVWQVMPPARSST